MRFLYVALESVGEDELERTILSRAAGVKQLGHQSDCAYRCGDELFLTVDGETRRVPLPVLREEGERAFSNAVCGLIEKSPYDILYAAGMFLTPAFLKIAAWAKIRKFGAKVIFEPEEYPLREYSHALLERFRQKGDLRAYGRLRSRMIQHRLCQRHLRGRVDTLAVRDFPVTEAWGVSAITIHTGITVGTVSFRDSTEELGAPISILGVSGQTSSLRSAETCGYDRILRGLAAYQSRLHREEISFDIAGGESDVAGLRAQAEQLGLGPLVNFLGPKSESEINALCNTHTVAASSLGMYRAGRDYCSPRLTKLFCAAGIPFLYAYEDVGLASRQPFALKLTDIDAPVSMEMVSEFVWRCRLNPHLGQQERKYAENYYDWRVLMKRVIEFTATGRREA